MKDDQGCELNTKEVSGSACIEHSPLGISELVHRVQVYAVAMHQNRTPGIPPSPQRPTVAGSRYASIVAL